MKRSAIILCMAALLGLCQVGWAADLQAGWYVKLAAVQLVGRDPVTHLDTGTVWNFTGGLGDNGPFSVSSPDPLWAQRMVSVTSTASGIEPGTSVYLWGQPQNIMNCDATIVGFYWETDYDASQMQLDLLMYNPSNGYTTLWSQTQSGHKLGFDNVLTFPQKIPVGYVPVFRVGVVPEPGGILTLLTGSGVLFGLVRRRLNK